MKLRIFGSFGERKYNTAISSDLTLTSALVTWNCTLIPLLTYVFVCRTILHITPSCLSVCVFAVLLARSPLDTFDLNGTILAK